MTASSIDRIANPLTDKFALDELPKIAPWVYEQIIAVGTVNVTMLLESSAPDETAQYPMTAWVSALSACHSELWQSLAQG
ncbi:MAG: hypothetical protein JWP99_486 [Devosia sp.]|nr:hypothetical protein [Devosia sp.]